MPLSFAVLLGTLWLVSLAEDARVVRTFPAGTAVTIEATNGTIRVTRADRPDIEITVATRAPTRQQLETTAPLFEEATGRVRIACLQPGSRKERAVVTDIAIRAPAATRFDAIRLGSGRIELEGLSGVVDARSDSGDIRGVDLSGTVRLEATLGDVIVERARLTAEGLLRLRAFQGSVRLGLAEVPGDARILATTFNGRISSAIPLRAKDGFGVRFAEATLGRGEPLISIDVVTGDVEITVRRQQ